MTNEDRFNIEVRKFLKEVGRPQSARIDVWPRKESRGRGCESSARWLREGDSFPFRIPAFGRFGLGLPGFPEGARSAKIDSYRLQVGARGHQWRCMPCLRALCLRTPLDGSLVPCLPATPPQVFDEGRGCSLSGESPWVGDTRLCLYQ